MANADEYYSNYAGLVTVSDGALEWLIMVKES